MFIYIYIMYSFFYGIVLGMYIYIYEKNMSMGIPIELPIEHNHNGPCLATAAEQGSHALRHEPTHQDLEGNHRIPMGYQHEWIQYQKKGVQGLSTIIMLGK